MSGTGGGERCWETSHSGGGPSSSNWSSASKPAAESHHLTPWLVTFGTPRVGPMSHAARVPGRSPTPLFEETKYSLEANVCDDQVTALDPGRWGYATFPHVSLTSSWDELAPLQPLLGLAGTARSRARIFPPLQGSRLQRGHSLRGDQTNIPLHWGLSCYGKCLSLV